MAHPNKTKSGIYQIENLINLAGGYIWKYA